MGRFYTRRGKRFVDMAASLAALVALAPVLALVALNVRRKLGTPVLFRQERPGLNGQPFTLIKFRTMTDCYDAEGKPLADANRMTPFGLWLRSTSLDELPELWNVFKGDMSLVGPRPLLMDYLPLYSPFQARRHAVRPGLTGWAQVNGRNAITWGKRFEMDCWYVDHISPRLDAHILLRTLAKVFQRDGISPEGQVTPQLFEG